MQPKQISNACSSGLPAALVAILLAALMLARTAPATAGTVATAVLGQENFTNSAANAPDAASLSSTTNTVGTALDKSATPNHLYVVDINNHRVLGYSSVAALTNGAKADLVIGQPDFFTVSCNSSPLNGAANLCYPRAVAVDSSGNVYIADGNNNRVLVFSDPFTIKANTGRTAGFSAFMVFGQAGDFSSTGCNVGGSQASASTLCLPVGLTLDSANNLYVADYSNNRVLIFNNPVATGNMSANIVLGQVNFTSNSANQGGSPSKFTLAGPEAVAVDSNNNIYVADSGNNRVLQYNPSPGIDTAANRVWGQLGNFTVSSCNNGGASASTLCNPTGVALDSSNNLYIADTSNHRVVEYNESNNPPTNTAANLAFGQTNPSTGFSGCNQGIGAASATTLCYPTGPALDSANDLFVLDSQNNRLLEYFTPLTGPNTTADIVLGQADFTHNAANAVDATSFYRPLQAALDKTTTPNHLYLADEYNHRVLGWLNATGFANGAPADLVIGQTDFQSGFCNRGGVSAATLCYPTGAAVDASGNLYVADYGNSRVLEYTNPFASCGSFPCVFAGTANKVFGQPNFISGGCNTGGSVTANTLCSPAGVALDSIGNLYVGDSGNNRVLEYNTPLTKSNVSGSGDTTADLVFGQGTVGNEFTTNDCNHVARSQNSLCNPDRLATDSANNLYVADYSNNRVLEYNEPSNATTAPNNVTANTVFGEGGNFNISGCNNGGLSADSLCQPTALNLDSSDNLYVGDMGNSRVLEFFTPLTTDTTADIVWGQGGSFESNGCNVGGSHPSAATLCRSEDVAVDGSGNVFITDRDNNRLLLFAPPFVPPGAQAVVAPPAGLLSIRPLRLTFNATLVGRKSRPQKVKIKNAGDTPVALHDISASGNDFIVGSSCGSVLAAGTTCTLTVTFKPVTTGKRGSQLLISDNARNSPHAVTLRGRGKRRGHSR